MSDIVERLRDVRWWQSQCTIQMEAADEITRLRAEVERKDAAIQNMRYAEDENHQRLIVENVRLREALEAVRFNLLQAGYKPDSIMIEGIDAALSLTQEKTND
jgi:hypothetical protein